MKTKPTLPVIDYYIRRDQKVLEWGELTLDVGKKTLVLGAVGHQDTEGTTDHGVLAHKDNTLASQGVTNLVHLLGRDLDRRK